MPRATADRAHAWAATASEHDVELARRHLTADYFGGEALNDAKAKINQRLQFAQFKNDTVRLLREGKITPEQARQGVAWAEQADYRELLNERERVERKYFGAVTPVADFSYR
jgi:hypothetical protein